MAHLNLYNIHLVSIVDRLMATVCIQTVMNFVLFVTHGIQGMVHNHCNDPA